MKIVKYRSLLISIILLVVLFGCNEDLSEELALDVQNPEQSIIGDKETGKLPSFPIPIPKSN